MADLPSAPFPILTTVAAVRAWTASLNGATVGFVPTMGALHSGHLSLVEASLRQNDHTIVSIFVNPAQFAPHEDLSTYPRTLESDLTILSSLSLPSPTPSFASPTRRVSALFLPPVEALYPSGITTDVSRQVGAFVEVKGLQDFMEGGSRPGFFRGVATVVLKLFNIVMPTRAYFGQKDIQQCLLLRRLLTDLHLSHPTPSNLIIIPTYRNPTSSLALSSRNAYLSPEEMKWADVLIVALEASKAIWASQRSSPSPSYSIAPVLLAATSHIDSTSLQAASEGISIQLLYISLNDPTTLELIEGEVKEGRGGVLSGAVMLGKTRLIDNLVFGFELN